MEPLQKLVEEAVDKHPNSIDDAVDAVLKKANRVAWFANLAKELIRKAITEMVHHRRHTLNVEKRRAAGVYGGPVSPDAIVSPDLLDVARDVYGYMIAGKTLSLLTGDELLTTAEGEANRATGHTFNAKLCTKLAKTVKGEKTVGQCFTKARLKKLFDSVA